MRRRNALVWVLLFAQELAATSFGQNRSPPNLLVESRWVRFDVILGHINASPTSCGQTRALERGDAESDSAYESITFNGDAVLPYLCYRRKERRRDVHIKVIGREELVIDATCSDMPPITRAQFHQRSDGTVELTLNRGSVSESFKASSLWHLCLQHPDPCTPILSDLLAYLRPDWQLEEEIARIEQDLCRRVPLDVIGQDELHEMIVRLDDPRFAVRRAAQRRLNALGISALRALERVEPEYLSGEQRNRLRQLKRQLHRHVPDTPERVAAWLANDPVLWQLWQDHPEPWRQRAAAEALAKMQRGAGSGETGQDSSTRFAQQVARDENARR